MKRKTLRYHVERALLEEWRGFETLHPRLARVCDAEALAEAAMDEIHDDPEYLETMADAHAAGTSAAVAPDVVRRFVGRWLGRLV